MAKKIKATPYIVIPDTNILWNDDPAKIVSSGFDKFWNTFSGDYNLELYIPEVVKGELLYQLTKPALKSISDIAESINNISVITGKQHRHNITNTKTKVLIEKRFDMWLKGKNGTLVQMPTNNIDWNEIINKAIWRLPPFEDIKKGKIIEEKGFRDSMILETIIDICKREKKLNDISFICNDKTLRTSANVALIKDLRFSSYESINDFQSYLSLLKEKLESQFVKDILGKASDKFFTQGNKDTYYYRENISGAIVDKYGNYISNPLESESGIPSPSISSLTGNEWEPTKQAGMWIDNAEFVKKHENTYYWKNKIEYHRLFTKKTKTGLLSNLNILNENLLVLPFYINWNCIVSSNKRFSNFKLDDINMEGNFFRTITDELREEYLNN